MANLCTKILVHRGFPGNFESKNLRMENLSMETDRIWSSTRADSYLSRSKLPRREVSEFLVAWILT